MINQKIIDDLGRLRRSLNETPDYETLKEEDLLNDLNQAVEDLWDYLKSCDMEEACKEMNHEAFSED
ncbi:MAG: hypothetical protein VST70_06910 [Nitrospirota bacterium]|nr:hypothetical protein [Nitrospirota bacterium]